MELFTAPKDPNKNRLPYDGEVFYYGKVFDEKAAASLFDALSEEIAWEHDQLLMFGKPITTKRKVAWYGSQPFKYTYSHSLKTALPFTPTLLSIKEKVESVSAETFNSCLLNLYHTGKEGMGWHSDDEPELKKNGAIASISFGASRSFDFKHKATKEKVRLTLENGSLLIMKGATQQHWLHQLPATKKVRSARVNLTFRTIIEEIEN